MPQPLALTFDDGPDPIDTPRLLDLLNAHEIKAVFFVWGEHAAEHPGVVQALLESGQSVQPHCWSHCSHHRLAPDQIARDIDAILTFLSDQGAPKPTLWRPPYGQLLRNATRSIATEHGLQLVGRSPAIDPEDWSGKDPEAMYDHLVGGLSEDQRPAVVLLHDGHEERGQPRPNADNTVELVRLLVDDGRQSFSLLEEGMEDTLTEA
jgi:peptidoglycan/xylan/chitin deacetylase (PgdA/CDA1 family)